MAQVCPGEVIKMKLNLQDVSLSYGATPILVDVSLEVNQGEFLAIVGPSGAGKTTLLNAISGFIEVAGKLDVPGKTGVVFQDHSVFPWMTVAGNIAFGLERHP